MTDYEKLHDEPSGQQQDLTIHLPGADGAPAAGGFITAEDRREMCEDPGIAPRLERVHHMVETGQHRFVEVDWPPISEPLD